MRLWWPHAGLVKQRGGSSFVEQNGKIIGVKWNSKDTDFLLAECENLSSYEQFPAPPPPLQKKTTFLPPTGDSEVM